MILQRAEPETFRILVRPSFAPYLRAWLATRCRCVAPAAWFGDADLAGFIHRASIHAEGISRNALAGRPVIGICNSWSELVNCNLHFRGSPRR